MVERKRILTNEPPARECVTWKSLILPLTQQLSRAIPWWATRCWSSLSGNRWSLDSNGAM